MCYFVLLDSSPSFIACSETSESVCSIERFDCIFGRGDVLARLRFSNSVDENVRFKLLMDSVSRFVEVQ